MIEYKLRKMEEFARFCSPYLHTSPLNCTTSVISQLSLADILK